MVPGKQEENRVENTKHPTPPGQLPLKSGGSIVDDFPFDLF